MPSAEEIQKNESSEKIVPLIDIFYKDTGRLYSLVSQIDRGTWQEHIETQEKTEKSEILKKGNVGVSRALGTEFSDVESEEIKRNIRTKKAPFDDIALGLLGKLNLKPKIIPPSNVFSRIDVLHGIIKLHNYKFIANVFPMLKQHPKAFINEFQEADRISLQIQELKKKKHLSQEERSYMSKLELKRNGFLKLGKEQQDMLEMVASLYKFFPTGIGFELSMQDGSVFSGQLKPDNLIDSDEVIFTNYGECLPAEWEVLGIIDYVGNTSASLYDTIENPMGVLTHFSNSIKGLLSKGEITGIIIPILIYRELVVPDE